MLSSSDALGRDAIIRDARFPEAAPAQEHGFAGADGAASGQLTWRAVG
jgi:hypothetical protein